MYTTKYYSHKHYYTGAEDLGGTYYQGRENDVDV
ncbi:hypothetical protein NIES4071_107210 (plasmid) [Calothrix sp. NIES-4071]|nr:hypothetical protein NIES4071_107210 [Calothrix sp. NIES-4071]BAZ64761.1 hypothetical protein NIES4105_104940 [Calothrix sp. NIES-4105]